MIDFNDRDYYYFNFTDQFIFDNKDKIEILFFSQYQVFNTAKIKKHYEIINFNLLYQDQKLSEESIDLLLSKSRVKLSDLIWHQKVSKNLIEKHKERIVFDKTALISAKLSKNFILKNYRYFMLGPANEEFYSKKPEKFIELLVNYPDKFQNRMFNKVSRELKKK